MVIRVQPSRVTLVSEEVPVSDRSFPGPFAAVISKMKRLTKKTPLLPLSGRLRGCDALMFWKNRECGFVDMDNHEALTLMVLYLTASHSCTLWLENSGAMEASPTGKEFFRVSIIPSVFRVARLAFVVKKM